MRKTLTSLPTTQWYRRQLQKNISYCLPAFIWKEDVIGVGREWNAMTQYTVATAKAHLITLRYERMVPTIKLWIDTLFHEPLRKTPRATHTLSSELSSIVSKATETLRSIYILQCFMLCVTLKWIIFQEYKIMSVKWDVP